MQFSNFKVREDAAGRLHVQLERFDVEKIDMKDYYYGYPFPPLEAYVNVN